MSPVRTSFAVTEPSYWLVQNPQPAIALGAGGGDGLQAAANRRDKAPPAKDGGAPSAGKGGKQI